MFLNYNLCTSIGLSAVFNKMYVEFEKNSKQSIKMKKKATILKMQAFSRVYDVLEDALN